MRKLLTLLVVLLALAPALQADTVVRMTVGYYQWDNTTEEWVPYGGHVDLRLFDELAPGTVANFLGYANSGAYDWSFFHRSVPGFVLQGGGYTTDSEGQVAPIATDDPIENEYGIPNTRGTVAMAKVGAEYDSEGNLVPGTGPDSATSQFFFNLADNTETLDERQNGGFTVFGHVLGEGMQNIDFLANQEVYSIVGDSTPLVNWPGGEWPIAPYMERIFEITTLTQLDGDVNLDGVVDQTDADIFRAHYATGGGKTWLEGDFNANGEVDFDDAWRLLGNYVGQAPPGGMMSYLTPEPATMAIVMLGGVAMLTRRRRVQ